MKIFILIFNITLLGCNVIYPYELKYAKKICKANGGLHKIELRGYRDTIICNNGLEKSFHYTEAQEGS